MDGPYPLTIAYIHHSLHDFSPTLLTTSPHFIYFQIISLNMSKQGAIYSYNVYNSSREEALISLADMDDLPPAFTIVGDFNLHSPSWDTVLKPFSLSLLHRLHDVMAKLNISLTSNPNIYTWFPPTNSTSCPSVIDLVWTDPIQPTPVVSVLSSPSNSFNSDHVVLYFSTSTKFFKPEPSLSIPVRLDEEESFITSLIHIISELHNLSDYVSQDHIQCEVSAMFNSIQQDFHHLAKKKCHTPHSVPWWNASCSAALANMHCEHNPHTYKTFKSSVHTACNKCFLLWVSTSASNHKLWDITVLTCPCPLPLFIMMCKLDSSTMSSKSEFW